MQKAIDAVVAGYLAAINWIAAHPHKTFWSGTGAVLGIAALAVFL